jgi:hypothetical protein
MYCTLYTKENLIYHATVDKKDVELKFSNGDKTNKYRFKSDKRGKFWIFY